MDGKYVMLGNVVIKSIYTICVTAASIYFNRPSLLWWYVLLLVIGYVWKDEE